MGGKTKHLQRTKNNTKPSSSGRSAELLATSTIHTSGFANVSEFGYLPTMLQGFSISDNSASVDDMDASIDTNFQMVFRKMTKKDPITRVKALQEFIELLGKNDATTIKSILPFWPRLYYNLATDVEHRVREAAQQAQAGLINQVGKGIAPYLKQLSPAWITSQYDTYPPAASVASASFQKAFPSHKLQDVFNFCQNEILDYIIKNLTFHTATTLSNPQSNSPEECEAKYQRVLICSLKGYALYLSKIPSDHLKEASNKNIALLENSKFWSYHKHKNAGVRAAWFEALAALLEYATDLIEKYEKQVASTALQNIDETEPVALPHVWASILLVTQKINDWHNYINMEKALLPKLWKMLKNGGDGNAETIYPHLLPLLSKLNKDVLGDKILPFYRNFFENIDTGLRSRIVHQASGRADITAIATAYYECIQYVIIQLQTIIKADTELEDEVNELYEKILNNHVLEFISFLLETNTSQNGKYVLGRIVVLLQFWSHNKNDKKLYDKLLLTFWTELYATIEKAFSIEKDDQHLIKNLDLIAEFIQEMRNDGEKKAKSQKVKFNFDEVIPAADDADAESQKTKSKRHLSLEASLTEFVIQLCKLYMKKISETNNSVYIGYLESLLKTYGNEEFFGKLSGQTGEISKLYDKFACWLLIAQLRLESVVDIILMLYPYLSVSEKSKLLNKLVKFPNEIVQYWILSRILSHPLCTEPDVIRLVAQQAAIDLLLKSAKYVTEGEVTENINLLHKCFFQNENGDILIDCKTCEAVIDILSKPLNSPSADDNVLDTCARFLAQVMPIVCSDAQKKRLQIDMFLRLFQLSLNKQVYSNLSEDTLWEVITSWQDALSSKDILLDDDLLDSCSTIIIEHLKVTVNDDDVSVATLESISEIVSKLILCSVERFDDDQSEKTQMADKIIERVFSKLLDEYEKNLEKTKQLCSFIECINGQMIPLKSFDMKYQLGSMNTTAVLGTLLKLAIFRFRVVSYITCNIKKDHTETPTDKTMSSNDAAQTENTDEEHTEDFCDLDGILLKQWSEKMFDEILNGIYVAYLTDTLLENATLPSNIETFIISLQERISQFLKNIPAKNITIIQEQLLNEAKLNDPFWAASVFCLLNTDPYTDSENGVVLLHNDLTKIINGTSNIIAYLNILQRFTGKLEARQLPISTNILNDTPEMFYKTVALRCLIQNYFKAEMNEISDQQIVAETLKLVDELYAQSKINKDFLLYNENIASLDTERILQTTEMVEFLTIVLEKFPSDLSANGWDFVRIAISSWVLSLSKSSDSYRDPKVAIFLAAVYKMFKALYDFIKSEYSKSSTKNLTRIVDEWESIFAKDVNLILLKCFMKFLQAEGEHEDNRGEYFLSSISQFMDNLDFKHVQVAKKIDSKTSIDDLIQFALKNLSHKYHGIRIACVIILKKMAPSLIENDMEMLNKRSDQLSKDDDDAGTSSSSSKQWHLLHKFNETLLQQNQWSKQYIDEFNYKSTELDDFSEIPKQKSIPFLLLWDCILHVCDKAPPELRSTYATFITENKYEQVLLNLLFRMMPSEVLRNQETKATGIVYFVHLSWDKISSNEISTERYACYVYVLSLKHLSAVVRKWWTNAQPRQKLLIDKITTAFVSNQLCSEELKALTAKKDKLDSIQIAVHQSTREVNATYSIDEARMELIIQLPLNYPLGAVKVSLGQQIGDKLQSRQLVRQLSIFLIHQNGSILDGLSLWKRNLDRKFEGVEECYVCYSVIHQETCQLPKQSCKTCKKRFHGQCLYKWFNTSNKSTCPICRNIF